MHTIRSITNFLIAAVLISLFAPPAVAQENAAASSHVDIRLVPEYTDVLPGDLIMIAIEQNIEEGWHTYWHNPGDSGAAPVVKWSGPEGFEFGDIRWPVPDKFQTGPLTTHIYENKAILLQEVMVPRELPDGPVTLTADIELLVCDEKICVPEFGTHSVTLNKGQNRTYTDYIDEAYNDLPLPVDWDAVYRVEEDRFIVETHLAQIVFMKTLGEKIVFDLLPYEWGIVDNAAKPLSRIDDMTTLKVYKDRGERPLDDLGNIKTLIKYHDFDGGSGAVEIIAKPDPAWLEAANTTAQTDTMAKTPPQPEAAGNDHTEPAQKKTPLLIKLKRKILGLINP